MTAKIRWLSFWVFLALALGGLVGCQVDVGGNVSLKGLYATQAVRPDGTKIKADPRQPMYEGSGYTERHGFGGETAKMSGFRGLAQSDGTIGGVK